MNNLEQAKKLLETNDYTCVLCKGETVLTSDRPGIAPMMGFLSQKTDLRGFSAADRIVGKAAAMLFLLAGVREVYASVMSREASELLKKNGVSPSWGVLVEHIINRQGTGLCPMEQAVKDISDPEQALEAIRKRMEELSKGKKEKTMKKLGFGMMRLPQTDPNDASSVDLNTVCQMVDTFLERGFTYFDTAYFYHNTQSECIVREALVKRHPRDRYTLATKLPMIYLKEAADMERIFNEQLEKCGVEYFDYYLLHNLNVANYETAEKLDAFSFITQKKKEGKIKKIGFSFHDTAEVLDKILSEHPEVEFVQLQINYLDWDSDSVQSGKCYEVAVRHQKPVIVMEPVKGGMLADVPPNAAAILREFAPNASVPSWAIRYAASLDQVMMVLSGMSNMQQVLDNTDYMQNFSPLSEMEKDVLSRALSAIREAIAVPCTGCGYCVEGCPKNIPIPKYFSLYNNLNMFPHTLKTQKNNYVSLSAENGKASDCIQCAQCEGACPQHLSIIEHLQDVAKTMEG